ncbi:MAG: Gfo/Idh/MocA family oxidoreductase [Tepidisphaeraceae bacterium]
MPIFVRAKQIVESGELGEITGASYRFARACHRENLGWRGDAAIAGGALTLDLGSHALNAIDWIVGPLEAIAGHSIGTAGVERASSLLFRTANGSPGMMQFNLATDANEEMIEISGTKGRLRWPCFGNVELTIERGKQITTERHPPGPHVHQPLIQSIVDELNGVGRCSSDAGSALRTTQLLDVAMAGARKS